MNTIIFLSGFIVPKFVSKSNWFFEEGFWKGHRTVFYGSKTPTSDSMVEREMYNLMDLINNHPGAHVIGHSLGCWWAANLACHPQTKMNKMVLWTPLGIAGVFPMFRVSAKYEPFYGTPNRNNCGPDKTLVVYAKNDLIVPWKAHAHPLIGQFNAEELSLNGGHLWQSDHKEKLILTKNWLELKQ